MNTFQPSAQPVVAPTVVNASLVGGIFDAQSVRDFIEVIGEALGDGVEFNVEVS